MKDKSKLKILAVSDKESRYLKSVIASKDFKNNFNFIISCGDLRKEYIEYLADGTNKLIYYINGNHHYFEKEKKKIFNNNYTMPQLSLPGGIDINEKIIDYNDFFICGFSGTVDYNHKAFQYSQKKMFKKVLFMIIKLKLKLFFKRLLGDKKRVIIISHAPVAGFGDGLDLCHSGFKAFNLLIKWVRPVLWLYGHIHLKDFTQMENYYSGNTRIVNVYEFKNIIIEKENIIINYKLN